MSTANLSITLQPRRNLSESYWISLEQIEEEKLATLSEAAEVIDALFLLDPCTPVNTPPTEEQNDQQQLDREAQLAAMAERYYNDIAPELQDKLCSENKYLADVKLTRSHQNKNYNLLIEGGDLLYTRLDTETVIRTVRVENSDILDAELPADKEISAVWLGPCWTSAGILPRNPQIFSEKGKVYWDGTVSGSIQLVYEQDYALLAIAANRDGCELTALYHLSVDGISVNAPEFDDAAEGLCASYDSHTYKRNPEEGDCYIETLHRKVCDCSGDQAGSHRTQRPATCPDKTPIGTVIAREDEVEYVSCGEVESVNDPDYYEQKCCEPPEVPLPRCREITRTFAGKGLSEEKRAELMRTYGDDVQIVLVGPDPPPCGKMIYEQEVDASNCCTAPPPISWEITHDQLEWNKSYVFTVDPASGTPPFTWSTSGPGLSINGSGSSALLSVSDCFCNPGQVIVTDACDQQLVHGLTPVSTVGCAAELLYDDENSADVIADDSDATIFWEGGKAPFWIEIEGDGFFLDTAHQLKAFQYQGQNTKIYTANSCGACSVVITDSCGDSVESLITSTVGDWEEIYNNPDGGWLDYDGVDPPPIYSGLLRGDHVGYTKNYKIEQTFYDLQLLNRIYFVDQDYNTVLAHCVATKYDKQPPSQEITGGVFYKEPGFCDACGECQGDDYSATGDSRSIDLGFHSRIWYASGWWSMESYWQTVKKTTIYKWAC